MKQLKQSGAEKQTSRNSGVIKTLIAFNHLVELPTINKPIAVSALGYLFSIQVFKVSFNPLQFFWGLLSIAFVLCYLMAINDCFDVEEDRLKSACSNKKLVVSVEISVRDALLISVIMLLIGLAISWFVSPLSFFIALLIVIISTPYSVPPIRYKKKFPYSTIAEIAGSMLPFLFGYAIVGAIDYRAVAITPFFALTQVFWRLIHERRFHDLDIKTGKKTAAIVYGSEATKTVGRICVVLAVSEVLILFFLGWFSFEFLFFLCLFYLFGFAFWDYIRKYIPKVVYNAMGPMWGTIFVLIVALFLIF